MIVRHIPRHFVAPLSERGGCRVIPAQIVLFVAIADNHFAKWAASALPFRAYATTWINRLFDLCSHPRARNIPRHFVAPFYSVTYSLLPQERALGRSVPYVPKGEAAALTAPHSIASTRSTLSGSCFYLARLRGREGARTDILSVVVWVRGRVGEAPP